MVACVVCAEGECSADCIFVDVFPADREESKINAEKVLSGWHVSYVKDLLMQAKVRGGVDLMMALVTNWIGKYQITSYYKTKIARERENKRIVAELTKEKEAVEKALASRKRKIEKNNDLIARQTAYLKVQRFVLEELRKNPVAASDASSSADRIRDQLAKLPPSTAPLN